MKEIFFFPLTQLFKDSCLFQIFISKGSVSSQTWMIAMVTPSVSNLTVHVCSRLRGSQSNSNSNSVRLD